MKRRRAMTKAAFGGLLQQRWAEALEAIQLPPGTLNVTWALGTDYPHFKTKRGYGVTFFDSKPGKVPPTVPKAGPSVHMMYAKKILEAPFHRADGIVRHEFGHVLDLCLPSRSVDRWALQRGIRLPHTDERRADAIAQAVWGEPILYDKDLVQSTSTGVSPRPRHLGL